MSGDETMTGAGRKPKAPTILDIAAEAGVSKSAVSRALLGQGAVSEATRERVEAAAARLGYVANAMAAGLRSRTKTIGAVLRDLKRPYYGVLFAAMEAQADRHGYRLVATTSAGELDVDRAITSMKSLMSMQVDGLILASAQLDSALITPYIDRVPMVVAGRMELGTVPGIYGDEAYGGQQLAAHVLAAGHQRIAVGLVAKDYSLSQHLSGIAMIEGIRAGGGTPVVLDLDDDWHTVDALETVLADSSITALMCPTDAAMMEVLEALRLRGLSVPHDLSVTGYGGTYPLSSPFLGLTSFYQPIEEIGAAAVDLVVSQVEKADDQSPTQIAIRGRLIPGRTLRKLTINR